MSFAIQTLENPSSTDIDEVVKLCLRAYNQEEISVKTLVGGNVRLLDDFFGASLRAGALGGKICVATEADNVIRGVALWLPPGAEPFSTDEQKRHLHAFISQLSREGQEWHRTVYGPEFSKLTQEALGARGKLDSWFLSLLAVDPQYQRRGVAGALIDAVRANGGEITLAATNELNVNIYRRMGFEVRGESVMSGPFGEFPVFVLSSNK